MDPELFGSRNFSPGLIWIWNDISGSGLLFQIGFRI
jgi:hypothetical protein